jgi:phosphatidylglycerol---prolipoprotein diacylglyceryl transferase
MMTFFPSRAIALTIGPVSIHWYGLMYACGFLCGLPLFRRMSRHRAIALASAQEEALLTAMILGVLLGGRLGYVLFYGDAFYWHNPLEIVRVWHGGMSSHGGFIGVALVLLWYTRRYKIPFFSLLDALIPSITLGLAFGRIGNLINGELYGTLTTLPIGMYFPDADGLRHPTQLYAVLKDLFLCASAMFLLQKRGVSSGMVTACFLMSYALLRSIVELFRDQPFGYTDAFGAMISRGQLLCIPLFMIGVMVAWHARRRIK